jgi:tetratricopeptide (TPR) repeat protein
MDPGVDFLVRLAHGTLPPVSRLTDGFVRPRTPQEVGHAYVQAALVCRWIEARFGARALAALLAAYRDGADTPAAFARVLRLSPVQVDSGFAAWVAQELAAGVTAVRGADARDSSGGAFVAAMREGMRLLATDTAQARTRLAAARVLFPGYAGGDGPAWPLARLALAALERLQWLWPYEAGLHARRGALAEALGRPAEAVAAWRAAVAARPDDLPAMRTGLARALAAAGDAAAARRELLGVLEEAPGYEPAQALLLALRRPPGNGGRP